jgi:hypothetical protein
MARNMTSMSAESLVEETRTTRHDHAEEINDTLAQVHTAG